MKKRMGGVCTRGHIYSGRINLVAAETIARAPFNNERCHTAVASPLVLFHIEQRAVKLEHSCSSTSSSLLRSFLFRRVSQ
jgi:hypothetical protein